MYNEDVTYAAEELKKIVGWQIKDTVVTDDGESYGFIVERDPHGKPIERRVIWVDCDPEGNGPGWLSIGEINENSSASG